MAKPKKRKHRKLDRSLPVMRPNAGGIDMGATEIFVAVPADRDTDSVRSFPTFTQDLHVLADWLQQCHVDTVAMESTGVYWIPLFQILEARGIEVHLVNAQHVHHVPGRKSDVLDCQWLQYLHSVGLLKASFRPEQAVCEIRSLMRHRENLVEMGCVHVQHIHKSLDQMNLQIHHVISDITGVTGLAILDAIVAGKTNPKELAKLRDHRIKASIETVTKSLVGDYRPEHIFTLKQSLTAYRYYQQLIADCDQEIQKRVEAFDQKHDNDGPPPLPNLLRHPPIPRPFNLRRHLERIFGVDLTLSPVSSVCGFRPSSANSAPIYPSFQPMTVSPPGSTSAPKMAPVRAAASVRHAQNQKPRHQGFRLAAQAFKTANPTSVTITVLNAPATVRPRPLRIRLINWPASFTISSQPGSPLMKPSLQNLKLATSNADSTSSNLWQSKWGTHSSRPMLNSQFLERGTTWLCDSAVSTSARPSGAIFCSHSMRVMRP